MESLNDTNIEICRSDIFEPQDIEQVCREEEFIKRKNICFDESYYRQIIENDSENCTPVANEQQSKSVSASTSGNERPSKQGQQAIKQNVPQTGYIVRCPKCSFFKEIEIEKEYGHPCPDCNIPLYYQCVRCNMKKDDHRFRKHKCDAKRSYDCDLCNFTTVKISYLQHHRRLHHKGCGNSENFLKCSRCKKSYKSKKYMIIHEKVCLPKSNWKCALCNFETHQEKRSRFHMMKHHPEVYNNE